MSKLQEKSSALKREHLALQKIKFIYFAYACWSLLPSWIRITNLDKDTDPEAPLNLDPQHCRWTVFMAISSDDLSTLCSIRQWCLVCGSWPSQTCTPWTGGGRTTCTASWPPSRPQPSQGTDALHTLTKSPTLCQFSFIFSSVADPDPNPDPSDPYVFGPPGSGYGSGSEFFYH